MAYSLFNQSQNAPHFAGLTDKYRPASLASFVGLDKPKRILSKLAASPFPSAWLFLGASGTGKTTMGLAIAEAIHAELHHIPSQECNKETIDRVRRICQYVPAMGFKWHLVLIDEADRMTDAAQVALLSKLDATDFPPNTLFIFTANDTTRLESRFLSRLRVVEFSAFGSAPAAAELLERVWGAEAPEGSDRPNFARIVKDAKSNIREALMALELELMAA